MNPSDLILPSNRKFGVFFATVFALIGSYLLTEEKHTAGYIICGLGGLFLLVTLINDRLLLPLNKAWMQLGLLLGMIVSPLVLGVIFFFLFTPISIIMKISGRDELQLKIKNKASYWKARGRDIHKSESFKNQF